MKIVLATGNQGKVRELNEILSDLDVEVLSLKEYPEIGEIVEDGNSFTENAIIKAKAVCDVTKLISLADDSGIEVDYLNGAPGIYSARFAGESRNDDDNNRKLLSLLSDVPFEKRTARFRCVIAICTPEGEVHTTEGICEGIVGFDPKGEKGFGYDPLFYLPEYDKTFAEIESEIKNKISHRARAVAKAKHVLAEIITKTQAKGSES